MYNIEQLELLESQGKIRKQAHPTAPLYIYNYTQQTQFDKTWCQLTLDCRGLILDSSGEIVARPFSKFFNLDEHVSLGFSLPHTEPFRVFEKLDGSLGVSYWLGDDFHIASRGSFDSIYAAKANELANKLYKHVPWRKDVTYLFEIIWPENRIVLDYKGAERLVLLGCRHIETGENIDIEQFARENGIDTPVEYKNYKTLADIKQEELLDKEGFVLLFESGLRVKYKFSRYVYLHKLYTRLSERDICDVLTHEGELGKLIEAVPDEIFDWVRSTEKRLIEEYSKIWNSANYMYWMIRDLPTRKDMALRLQNFQYKSIVFNMLDHKDYKPTIWKLVRETCTATSRFSTISGEQNDG